MNRRLGAAPAAAAILALLAGGFTAIPAAAGVATSTTHCTGILTGAADQLARTLEARVTPVVAATAARVSVSVYDWRTGITCTWWPTRGFDSASVIKVSVVATLVWQRQTQGRSLTATERTLARRAIVTSDNDATSRLWSIIGRGAGLTRFLSAAGMTTTRVSPTGAWGLTQIRATDQVRLLRQLSDGPLLGSAQRGYVLGLMRAVTSSQRWGATAGAPAGATIAVKNGWLPRRTAGWRINSIADIRTATRHYAVVVLSDRNPSMTTGIRRIEAIARVANRALAV